MPKLAFFVLLGLAACAASDATQPNAAAPPVATEGWQLPSGKAPSKAEFAAVVAACQDRAKGANQNGPLDQCLTDFGLRRAP